MAISGSGEPEAGQEMNLAREVPSPAVHEAPIERIEIEAGAGDLMGRISVGVRGGLLPAAQLIVITVLLHLPPAQVTIRISPETEDGRTFMSQILRRTVRESPTATGQESGSAHRPKHAARGGRTWLHRARQETLADEILAAARELFDSVDVLHYCHDWPYEPAEQNAFEAVHQARRAISQGGEMTEAELVRALLPVTHEWWPELSPLVADAKAAVERIRRATVLAKYQNSDQSLGEAAA